MNQTSFAPEPKFFEYGQKVKTKFGIGSIQGHTGDGSWLVCIDTKTMPKEIRIEGQWFMTIIHESQIESLGR
jgi:hypothetical protein